MSRSRRIQARAIAAALSGLIGLVVATPARAETFAPIDQPDPALSVPKGELAKSLQCADGVTNAAREPVLLVPGTAENPDSEFSWNWVRALAMKGWPYCTVALPGNGMGDIQIAGEYLVNAIRTMYQRSGQKVQIVGHSQGGMVPRWALRFWPHARHMVDDLVGIAPSNHGTADADYVCPSTCAPAVWQQRDTANFIKALNSRQETFAGISYTVIYTHTDEIVVPNSNSSGSSSLHGGGGQIANIAVQGVCPLDTSEHLALGSYDNVAYELAIDALTHQGPADPMRVSSAVCGTPLMPGVDPGSFASNYAAYVQAVGQSYAAATQVPQEPALACYTTASCPRIQLSVRPRRAKAGKRQVFRVKVMVIQAGASNAARGALVSIRGRRHRTNARGLARFILRFRRTGRKLVRVWVAGVGSASAAITVKHTHH